MPTQGDFGPTSFHARTQPIWAMYVGATLGVASSQRQLAFYYHGRGRDHDTACAKWATRAARAGDADAQYLLAELYLGGFGVEKSPDKAFRWYSASANAGYIHAQHALAWCFEQGVGTVKNAASAFDWYMKAASQGLGLSMVGVAHCLWKGLGVERNPDAALLWARQALERDADGARDLVDEIMKERWPS